MSDKEPILFRAVLGSLRPATPAAEDMVGTLNRDRLYKLDVHGIRGNTARLGLYWVCLKVGCEQLSDAVDGILTPRVLHRRLKREHGLSTPIISKRTGEIIEYDDESIAFESMPESERAQFIDAALGTLSRWIGTDITTLRNEGEARFGERRAA
jgi:hypothetical protein